MEYDKCHKAYSILSVVGWGGLQTVFDILGLSKRHWTDRAMAAVLMVTWLVVEQSRRSCGDFINRFFFTRSQPLLLLQRTPD